MDDLEACPECGASMRVYDRECPSCGADLFEAKADYLRELRDGGGMTPEAYEIALDILLEGREPSETPPRGERKQVTELTPADLDRCPVWEFAIDEEGEPGQDEATVKPRPDLGGGVNPDDGLFIVRAEFKAANGGNFDGFVTPDPAGDLGATQPSVVTGKEHVSFWFGMAQPEPQEIERSYSALGVQRGQLFPMTFKTVVPVGEAPMEGEVRAFMYLDDKENPRQMA